MPALLARLEIILLLFLLGASLVWAGRLFVARQRSLALAAEPLHGAPGEGKVRILAFSSATCTQCHTLQRPALRTLHERYGTQIEVLEIDAPTSPDLTSRYHILTVPSTVLLNASGEAVAVNYGFANTEKLERQCAPLLSNQ